MLPLRARVLRAGRTLAESTSAQDALPGTAHLAAVTGAGDVVGVVTYFLEATPLAPARRAVRFRGMAVDGARRGSGVGRALMRDLVRRARALDATILWASGRDGALGFYERIGFRVAGEGFLDDEMRLPHHIVIAGVSDITA